MFPARTKHLKIGFYFVKERIANGCIVLCICFVSHKGLVSPYFHQGASFCQILDDQIQPKPYFKLYLVIEQKKKKKLCTNYCKRIVYIFACIENILCNYVSFLNTIGIYAILHIVVINTQFHTHHMWG